MKRSVRLHLLTMQYLPRNAHWIQHSALKIKNNWPSNEKEINLLPHEYPSRLITLFSNYAPTLHKRQTMIVVTRTEGRHVLKVVTVIFNILSSFGNNIDAIEFFFPFRTSDRIKILFSKKKKKKNECTLNEDISHERGREIAVTSVC